MSRHLLIAGYGFLGRALKSAFNANGWQVSCANRGGSAGAVACDLSSAESTAAISGEYDVVVHCAASGGGGIESYRDVYLKGCRNLLARFPESRIIFTSSTSVYPQVDHSTVTEMSLAEPVSSRAAILRESEDAILTSGGIVARLTGLYGPGRCHIQKNFLAGTAMLDGKGERIMNFVHRDDVAQALILLADKGNGGEIYNVNGGYASQRDVYRSLGDYYDLPLPLAAADAVPRKRGNTSKEVNSDKLKQLGWRPRYTDFLSLAFACDTV